MSTYHLRLAAVLAAALAAGCSAPSAGPVPAADAAGRSYGTLLFKPCTLTSTRASDNVEAQCATLQVAENPAAPQGRRISLNIAWLEAGNAGKGKDDPVFFLAGGPGQAATEVAAVINQSLREVRKQRDIILVDQRGTGKSNPLTCLGADGKELALDETATPSAALIRDFAARCAASLADRADTRFYTTTQAIADIDAVRAALGVDKINLIGGSYGTRVAQHYAARYPQHTRSVVIDGVAPNDVVVGGDFAGTFEAAIDLQATQCRQDPACAKRFPVDTRTQLRNVMTTLAKAPVEVEYRDPGTAETRRDTLTADSVTGLAFMFSYMPELSSLLPVVLDEAAHGRYAPLMSLSAMAGRSLGVQMNRGMQWSVICAEDADRYREPPASDRLLGPEVARMFFAACPAWNVGSRPADFTAPFNSTLPILLLSGEFDPVTPPRYAEQVLKTLPNGRHLLAKGQGHGTLGAGCMPRLLGQFLDSTDAKALDARCLDTLSPVPAFTSFNGWEP
ncbi:alpha/beta hydrolase [Stenotrophomonas rhizophila]|uniref:alpha/beta hydrolase n=1 Tax=Stenotrophomonas rhizophila TaxID=216778 RepID=UPI001E36D975|nr:alpha/beta hydrolase [Stenotrophomonas rhizophila]MCC7634473.1 alpha/beta fold hydrolase [Stenotrophomonas rhizophila]MCC7663871.1 alpha/beta fold hydrolase [Stenotrophomonas rhizophila]